MAWYQKFIAEKAKRKREIFGSAFLTKTPVLLIDFNYTESVLNSDRVKELLAACDAVNISTIVSNPGNISEKEACGAAMVSSDEYAAALKAADFVLAAKNDRAAKEAGCVPIAQYEEGTTTDYNPLKEEGNGFFFKNKNIWEIFAALIRARETYQFPYDWENLIREITGEKEEE